jgi:chromosome partitioning protein
MTKTITITNQKGGVGKTTTAHSLAAGLKAKGYSVLAVDLDPQGNLSYGYSTEQDKPTVYEVLKGEASALEAIQRTVNGDILPANILLSGADMEFTRTGREYLLTEALKPLQSLYDFIILDTPPALNILTINAFSASDSLIIPMGADIFSLQGMAQLHKAIEQVKKYVNPNLKVEGILITNHNPRTVLGKDMADTIKQIADQLDTKLFKTAIRATVTIQEAQTQQTDIYSYSPKGTATADYSAFIDELMKGSGKHGQKGLQESKRPSGR